MNNNNQTTSKPIQERSEFVSIDDPKLHWPPFILSMLRIGRLLTAKENVRREITASQISQWMNRHKRELPAVYTGREIRENFEYYNYWLVGGGIQISGDEMPVPFRGPRQYCFTITKLYAPDEPNQSEMKQPSN